MSVTIKLDGVDIGIPALKRRFVSTSVVTNPGKHPVFAIEFHDQNVVTMYEIELTQAEAEQVVGGLQRRLGSVKDGR